MTDTFDRQAAMMDTLQGCVSLEEALREAMLTTITLAATYTHGDMVQAQLLVTLFADTVGGYPPPPNLDELTSRWAQAGRPH